MTALSSYLNLQKYFYRGDLQSFKDCYLAGKQTADGKSHLLAARAFQEMRTWDEVRKCLQAVVETGTPIEQVKGELQLESIEFVLTHQSRDVASKLLEKSKDIAKKNQKSELNLFSKMVQLRIEAALITLGLTNADEKDRILTQGKELMISYQQVDGEAAANLLLLLMNHSLSAPYPNALLAMDMYKYYVNIDSEENDIWYYSWHSLTQAKSILESHYIEAERIQVSALPTELQEIQNQMIDKGHVCVEALMASLYGSHLLDLECIEGLDWISEHLDTLWKFGHKREVIDYKRKCLNWTQDRGQVELNHKLTQNLQPYKQTKSEQFSKDLEKLNVSFKHFVEGDYASGEKILSAHLDQISSEANRVHLVSLMVNNASKIATTKQHVIKLIQKEVDKLEITKSVLYAQLLTFKGILSPTRAQKANAFLEAAEVYVELGYLEDAIQQFKNYFLERTADNYTKGKPIMDDHLRDIINRIESLLDGSRWVKNPTFLRGIVFQTIGQVLSNGAANEQVVNILSLASSQFSKGYHLQALAINTNYLMLNLIQQGRNQQNLDFYLRAIEEGKKALDILSPTKLLDFQWRLLFYLALANSEPIKYKLFKESKSSQRASKNAKDYYFKALSVFDSVLINIKNSSSNQRVLAAGELNKDARQLIFSGFYFFLMQKDLKTCIIWLEKFRSKSLSTSIVQNLITSHLDPNGLIIRENALLKQIETSDSTKTTALRAELQEIYDQMKKESNYTYYLKARNPEPFTFDEVRSILERFEASNLGHRVWSAYYFTHEDGVYLFCFDKIRSEPYFTKISVTAQKLQELITRFDITKMGVVEMERETRNLFNELVAPLKKWTNPEDVICIVPYGFLHDIPFHILTISEEPLITRNPIFYNTSLYTWRYMDQSINKSRNSFAIFGNPRNNLEASEKEANRIASLLRQEAYLGQQATKEEFLKALKKVSFLHFAGHGFFGEGKGLETFWLEMAGEDKVTAKDLLNQENNCDLVVLSACDTAKYVKYHGEEHAGLISALLGSGVKSVIAHHWLVDDQDALAFFSEFYQNFINGMPVVIAFQQAMKALYKSNQELKSWAGFMLYGFPS
ncbi:CHAT domain-containing protein [Fulvivirgaceae bacterium BMA12]|uniref:CHAT domain-containing protein n=1 Tax=Agaribacillus aureus TaxID=3051825 RepID=A0ABT8LAD9_9BACT|nr:CHAT domain-containing protein [Fulvivirgaceae bacterium BMA12]